MKKQKGSWLNLAKTKTKKAEKINIPQKSTNQKLIKRIKKCTTHVNIYKISEAKGFLKIKTPTECSFLGDKPGHPLRMRSPHVLREEGQGQRVNL